LVKIIDYDPSAYNTTKCIFLKQHSPSPFSGTTKEILGGDDVYTETNEPIPRFNTTVRLNNSDIVKGTSTIDFGAESTSTELIVTGITGIVSTTIIFCQMRMESTNDHTLDDLKIDPIRVVATDLVIGVGFTIYGTMNNAPASGKYKVDWQIIN
jgi:hypothetical protein